MTKEYEISDILNAVNSIYKTEGVSKKNIDKNN